jgi:hypothetical protein
MSDAGELALRVKGPSLDSLVDGKMREGEQLVEEVTVVPGVAGGVAGLEKEGEAGRDSSGLKSIGDFARAGLVEVGMP